MKKTVLMTLVANLTWASLTFATSIGSIDLGTQVRLRMSYGPIVDVHKTPVGSRVRSAIQVFSNGDVYYYPPGAIHPANKKKIAALNAHQMDRIERLIDEASEGVLETTYAKCPKASTRRTEYFADEYKVELMTQELPCGKLRYNSSPATEKLVKILNRVKAQG